jgi:hypothetical protein
LTARGVEGVAYRHIGVGMGMMFVRFAANHQFLAGDGDIDTHMIEISRLVMPVLRLHHYPATHDLIAKLIQLSGPFLDIGFHGLGTFHVPKIDLQRQLHNHPLLCVYLHSNNSSFGHAQRQPAPDDIRGKM